MSGEATANDIAAALATAFQDQGQGPGPFITPRSYAATLMEFFGTTRFEDAFTGFPSGPGMKTRIAVPIVEGAEYGDHGGNDVDYQEMRAQEKPNVDSQTRGSYLDPIQVTEGTPTAKGSGKFQYVVNPENGAMLYEDGTIVDPDSGVAIVRPGEVGSMLWLRTRVPHWDQKRIQEWRKKLFSQGYEVAPKGGIADDFISALYSFHQNRYLNGGEVVPMLTADEIETKAKDARKDAFSKADARNAVRAMFQRTFGDDPTDTELDEWSGFMVQEGTKMARKGIKGYEGLAGRTFGKAEDRFLSDPSVKQMKADEEEDEYAGQAFERFFQAFGSL